MSAQVQELLTTKDVARILAISPHTLEVARSEGGRFAIPFIKMGRAVLYYPHVVEEFIHDHVTETL